MSDRRTYTIPPRAANHTRIPRPAGMSISQHPDGATTVTETGFVDDCGWCGVTWPCMPAQLAAAQARIDGLLLVTEELRAQAWNLTASLDTIVRELKAAVTDGEITADGLGDVLPIAETTLHQYAATADHAFVSCTHGWGCSNEWCHYEGCPLRPDRHVSVPQIDAILAADPEEGGAFLKAREGGSTC